MQHSAPSSRGRVQNWLFRRSLADSRSFSLSQRPTAACPGSRRAALSKGTRGRTSRRSSPSWKDSSWFSFPLFYILIGFIEITGSICLEEIMILDRKESWLQINDSLLSLNAIVLNTSSCSDDICDWEKNIENAGCEKLLGFTVRLTGWFACTVVFEITDESWLIGNFFGLPRAARAPGKNVRREFILRFFTYEKISTRKRRSWGHCLFIDLQTSHETTFVIFLIFFVPPVRPD